MPRYFIATPNEDLYFEVNKVQIKVNKIEFLLDLFGLSDPSDLIDMGEQCDPTDLIELGDWRELELGTIIASGGSGRSYVFKDHIKIENQDAFRSFLNRYVWHDIIITEKPNGFFLWIELDDSHYGTPCFKMFPV